MVVVPTASLVTTPLVFTVAIAGFELLHAPPDMVSLTVSEVPMHRFALSAIDPDTGSGLTVTVVVPVTVPQSFVTI